MSNTNGAVKKQRKTVSSIGGFFIFQGILYTCKTIDYNDYINPISIVHKYLQFQQNIYANTPSFVKRASSLRAKYRDQYERFAN